jgi:hypothetical protein
MAAYEVEGTLQLFWNDRFGVTVTNLPHLQSFTAALYGYVDQRQHAVHFQSHLFRSPRIWLHPDYSIWFKVSVVENAQTTLSLLEGETDRAETIRDFTMTVRAGACRSFQDPRADPSSAAFEEPVFPMHFVWKSNKAREQQHLGSHELQRVYFSVSFEQWTKLLRPQLQQAQQTASYTTAEDFTFDRLLLIVSSRSTQASEESEVKSS